MMTLSPQRNLALNFLIKLAASTRLALTPGAFRLPFRPITHYPFGWFELAYKDCGISHDCQFVSRCF